MTVSGEVGEILWFAGWLAAVCTLFASALALPQICLGRRTLFGRVLTVAVSLLIVAAITVLANAVLTRHDRHFDFTRERVFTPDAAALAVVQRLQRPVQLTYFFRTDDPEGKRAQHIVELMGRENKWLNVETIDPDRHPSLAQGAGVKFYNAALLEADGRRVIVRSTNETEIAIGIQKVLRERIVTVCFMGGHGQYPSDNYEFHTHVEELGGGHSGHGHGANAIVETTGHGVGRFRSSLEGLGYEVREIISAIAGAIDETCNVVIDAGPKTSYGEAEIIAFERYLNTGGAVLLLYDVGFAVTPRHARLLSRLGITLDNTVVVDPELHYSSDPEMVAVTVYEPHAITRQMSFAFFPGVRPLLATPTDKSIVASALFSSSQDSYRETLSGNTDVPHEHEIDAHPSAARVGGYPLGVAIEGHLNEDSSDGFRAVVVGDSDFASNSFYPYMSNNRLALAMLRWLAREEDNVAVAARIPVPRTVELTNDERTLVFVLLMMSLPLAIALLGIYVWWTRR